MRLTLDLYARRSQQAIETLQLVNGQLEAEISQRKRFEESLEHQASHDPLTDFPNRSFLRERLDDLVKEADDEPAPFALLLLDLIASRRSTTHSGHQYGDMLLREVAERLSDRLRVGDTLARLGGDEFGVLLPGADAEGAKRVARMVLDALEQPLRLEGQELEVDASVGIRFEGRRRRCHHCQPQPAARQRLQGLLQRWRASSRTACQWDHRRSEQRSDDFRLIRKIRNGRARPSHHSR